jgi:hypothetical protein
MTLIGLSLTSKAQTSTRDLLNNLSPFWEFLVAQEKAIEASQKLELTAELEYSAPYIRLALNDTSGKLFYRVHYQVESSQDLTKSSFYCADLKLSDELAPVTDDLIKFFFWDSLPKNNFTLSTPQIDYLNMADRIATADDHHGVRQTILLTDEQIHIIRSNHWNARSLDHKDSYFMTDLEFIIPLNKASTDTLSLLGSTRIGDMTVVFYDGSAASQKAYGEQIEEKIAYEKKNYDALIHLVYPSIQTLLEASKPLHNETVKLKFPIRVLPDNGWFLKFYTDGHYEYVHWSAWRDDGGYILEHGSYSIDHNRILLAPKSEESEFKHSTFYLVTTTEYIDNNITIDCKKWKGTTYCLYTVYEE